MKATPQPAVVGHQPTVAVRRLGDIGHQVAETVMCKNVAYGSSFEKCGDFLRLLYPGGLTPEQYDDALLLVRIFDKQMRIATRKDAFGESPYRDLAGYGILGAAADENRTNSENLMHRKETTTTGR